MTKNVTFSICLPSKNRETRLNQMIHSAFSTSSNPSAIEFCIYLDENDSFLPRVPAPSTLKLFRGPRMPTSTMTNFMYSQSEGEFVMYAADDIIFRTNNWDSILLNTFRLNPDVGLIYGDDLSANTYKIATHGFVRRSMCEKLNYLLPPYFESEFCDTWLTRIFKASRRLRRVSEIVVEHMHPNWNKSENDETYSYRSERYVHLYLFLKQYFLLVEFSRDVKALK